MICCLTFINYQYSKIGESLHNNSWAPTSSKLKGKSDFKLTNYYLFKLLLLEKLITKVFLNYTV